jgi:hypothetical protein
VEHERAVVLPDGNLSITATEADPDVALDELTRYAAADH